MQITIVGSGDAFGSGGRLNTCFHVAASQTHFLIDCGATSLPALKRLPIDRNAIETVLITHFHADHCGGVPFFILDAQFFAKRGSPLTLAGPAGLGDWLRRAMEMAFPGSSSAKRKFEVRIRELEPGRRSEINGIEVMPQLVRHGQPEGAFFAYRIECDERVIGYTGDTEWTDSLIEVGKGADLFIAEAYFFEKQVPLHLAYKTLAQNLPRIAPRRVLLTHMNDDMLAHADQVPEEKARDGLVLTL